MTFFPAIPVPETQIGIAKEATRGTAVEPTAWIPIEAPKYKPDLKFLMDNGLRGSMVDTYDAIPSLRMDSHGWDQYLYLDTFPLLLLGVMGPDHKTTAPTATTLTAEAAAGATTIETAASVAAGSYIRLGSGSEVETHQVKEVTGSFVLTLTYPTIYTHASSATVTGLTRHRFSLQNEAPAEGNQPKSFTLTDGDGEEHWRAIAACQLDSLNIQGSADALPKATVAWMGNASVTPSEPSPSYTTTEAPPGWALGATIGSTVVTSLENWEFDFKRNVKPIPALTGTQNYYQFYAGALGATGKLTVLENREATWLNAYERGEKQTLDITLYDIKSGFAFNIHSTEAKFTGAELDRSSEYVKVPLEVQLLPTSTDALSGGVSPCVLTVANETTTEY